MHWAIFSIQGIFFTKKGVLKRKGRQNTNVNIHINNLQSNYFESLIVVFVSEMFDGYLQHVIKIKGLILEQIILRNIHVV